MNRRKNEYVSFFYARMRFLYDFCFSLQSRLAIDFYLMLIKYMLLKPGHDNLAATRVEELLPLVDDNTPASDKKALELSVMSDIVIAYEKEHFPIERPTVAELSKLSLEEKWTIQKKLAGYIGVNPSRINDYIAGRSEPTLKVARRLCMELNIPPAAMLHV
jgi:HTH-type transcriptional regulator/antitoxin HigA